MPPIGLNQNQISQQEAELYTADTAQPDADISNGTVNKDVMDVISIQLATAYLQLETARLTASLKNNGIFTADAMSQTALNFGVLIAPATAATGTVTFQAKTKPTSTIYIPIGTLVYTKPLIDGTFLIYNTRANATMDSTATLNPLNSLYEVDVTVQALVTGTGSNVGLNALTVLPNRISGIYSVTNKAAINNATDKDTNQVVADNILSQTAGVDLGTVQGYKDLITDQFTTQISGVDVVSPFNADNLRVQYGNEVDIPVISVDAISFTVNATCFTTIITTNGSPITYLTDNRPTLSISSVVGTTNGYNYNLNVDYGFSHDTSAVYGYSTRSFDGLCWFPNKQPGVGLKLSITGTYDQTVNQIQAFLNDPTKAYITGDLLVKTAQKIPIDIDITVSALSGFDRTQLKTNVISAITAAFRQYTLGQDILEDDIIDTVNLVPGVAFINVPFTTLKKSTDTVSANAVNLRLQEYAGIGTLTVTVN